MKNSIQFGTSITSSHIEMLQEKPVHEIIAMIKGETGNLKEEIRRLHNIRRLDVNVYRRQKTILPFICGSTFRESLRKAENFEAVHSFIIDFDDCASNKEELNALKQAITRRKDVWFCYLSPSHKGLKAAFRLTQPITEPKKYADFYKTFSLKVAAGLHLRDKVDLVCHDVSRVSFLSYDPDVYYNPDVQDVNPDDYLMPLFNEQSDELQIVGEDEQPKNKPEAAATPDNYKEIISILNPKYRETKASRKPEPYVPDMLDHLDPIIVNAVSPYDIRVKEVIPIQYGKKYCFSHGLHLAEINVFYGKKGFSVVISPKRNTHPALNELVYKLIFVEIHSINLTTQKIRYVLPKSTEFR